MPNQPKMIETKCIECQSIFKTAAYNIRKGNGKYCSTTCRYAKSRIKTQCSYCNKDIIKSRKKVEKQKTKYIFCSNKCKYDAVVSPVHDFHTGMPRTRNLSYRKFALRNKEHACVRCGYSEHIELLDIDHIDSNRINNSLDNLQVLCVMCHAIKTRRPDLF